jgi:6-phosphogluconolactonase
MGLEIVGGVGSLEEKCLVAAASIFEVLAARPSNEPLVIGLCGGRSVVGLLKALEQASKTQPRELLRRMHFFMVDERIVPLTDPDSNFGGLRQQLFSRLVQEGFIEESQLRPFIASIEDAQSSCDSYLQELQRLGGRFTIVVLGVGEDGHVAGLFPRHPALTKMEAAFIPFFDSPKPPAARMTASRTLVVDATMSVLLVLGDGKRAAWERFKAEPLAVDDCPAQMVKTMNRCLVVTDLA